MASIDKGFHPVEEVSTALLIPGHHPCLNKGISLPIPALLEVVLFHRRAVQNERTTVSIRSQPHINPEDLVDATRVIKAGNNLSRQSQKKLLET